MLVVRLGPGHLRFFYLRFFFFFQNLFPEFQGGCDSPDDSGGPLDAQKEKQGPLSLLLPFSPKWVWSRGQSAGCEQTVVLNLTLLDPAALSLTTSGALGRQGG